MRNPIRRWRFEATDAVDIRPTPYDLSFLYQSGSWPWTIEFQGTAYLGEPGWFDLAETITGTRPIAEDDLESDD